VSRSVHLFLYTVATVCVMAGAVMCCPTSAREVAPLKPATRPAAKVVSIETRIVLHYDNGDARELPAQVHLFPGK
jgi:hypothetical protein